MNGTRKTQYFAITVCVDTSLNGQTGLNYSKWRSGQTRHTSFQILTGAFGIATDIAGCLGFSFYNTKWSHHLLVYANWLTTVISWVFREGALERSFGLKITPCCHGQNSSFPLALLPMTSKAHKLPVATKPVVHDNNTCWTLKSGHHFTRLIIEAFSRRLSLRQQMNCACCNEHFRNNWKQKVWNELKR